MRYSRGMFQADEAQPGTGWRTMTGGSSSEVKFTTLPSLTTAASLDLPGGLLPDERGDLAPVIDRPPNHP